MKNSNNDFIELLCIVIIPTLLTVPTLIALIIAMSRLP